MDPLRDLLLHSTTLAATNAQLHPDEVVTTALRWGLRAARLGRVLPLGLLLDVVVLARAPQLRPVFPEARRLLPDRPEAWARELATAYDAWMRDFIGSVQTRWVWEEEPPPGKPRPCRDYLPFVLGEWPDVPQPGVNLADLARTYQTLLEDVATVRQAWARHRAATRAMWDRWWKAASAHTPSEMASMWARFVWAAPALPLAERFDHDAVHRYLRGTDPYAKPWLAHQVVALRHAAPDLTQRPENQERTTLHPILGAFPLSRLVQDEIDVAADLANNRGPRLTDDPRAALSTRIEIHLGFGVGFAALQRAEARSSPTMHAQTGLAQASALQALVALLLDDWREAVNTLIHSTGARLSRGLKVRFHLHRFAPQPVESVDLGRPGPRWKSGVDSEPLPPAELVKVLFERFDHVRLAFADKKGLPWACEPPQQDSPQAEKEGPPQEYSLVQCSHVGLPRQWRCGCVLTCDLPDLGFQPQGQMNRRGASWSDWAATRSRLPPCLQHLIVIDAAREIGCVCQVDRLRDGWRLRPLNLTSREKPAGDMYFGGVRREALELLLRALHSLIGGRS